MIFSSVTRESSRNHLHRRALYPGQPVCVPWAVAPVPFDLELCFAQTPQNPPSAPHPQRSPCLPTTTLARQVPVDINP